MSFFSASPFLKALGWALLNSVWQFAILCFLYWIITTYIKKLTATARHNIALYLLLSGAFLFLITLCWKYYSYPAISGNATENNFTVTTVTYNNIWNSAQQIMDYAMPYASLLYLFSIAVLFLKFCLFVRNAGQLKANAVQKMTVHWRTYVRNIAGHLGIDKEVKVVLSLHVDTPQVIGFLKPVILVPAACLTHLSAEQLEAVLLHELVHIKRNDYCINLFIASIEIVFFFNPFVNLLINAIRKEREYSCDDMVMQFQYQPRNYAAALLTLEKNRTIPVTFGIAASGKNHKQLLARIERIVGINNKRQNFSRAGAYFAVAFLLGFIALVNPAKVAADHLNAGIITYANKGQAIQENYSSFTSAHKTNPLVAKDIVQKNRMVYNLSAWHNEIVTSDVQKEDIIPVVADDEDISEVNIETAAAKEKRDFSLPEIEIAAAPAPELLSVTPYIPANSFSYQLIQDSGRSKEKGETYNERMAREALVKAKKAVQAINWQKIEKTLKQNSRDLVKLKLEITNELAKLNWQQINKDVQSQLNLEQLEKVKEAVQQDQSIKRYQQNQAYFEALQKQLLEQEQIIKESDMQMQKTQKALLQQQQKVQQEMKKRRIIYI